MDTRIRNLIVAYDEGSLTLESCVEIICEIIEEESANAAEKVLG